MGLPGVLSVGDDESSGRLQFKLAIWGTVLVMWDFQ